MNTETTQRLIRLKESDPTAWPTGLHYRDDRSWYISWSTLAVPRYGVERFFIGHWSLWLDEKQPEWVLYRDEDGVFCDDRRFAPDCDDWMTCRHTNAPDRFHAMLALVERVAEQQQPDGEGA